MGIGKRELFQDYYPDEISVVIQEYAALIRAGREGGRDKEEEPAVPVDILTFLGEGKE